MKIEIGSNIFGDVKIPLLWGERAVLQDPEGAISIVNVGGSAARLEVLGDAPAPGTEFTPEVPGFVVHADGSPRYRFDPKSRTLTDLSGNLPEVQISPNETRIGTNIFSANMIIGSAVGILVTSEGISIGVSQLPPGLAALLV